MKKLVVRREVVRDLTPAELSTANGGFVTTAVSCTNPVGCYVGLSVRECVVSLKVQCLPRPATVFGCTTAMDCP